MRSALPALAAAALLLSGASALGDDWPTYRHDNQRSAVSAEALRLPLAEAWVFSPTHPPAHAWGDPQPKPVEEKLELPRLRFDDAFHVVAAGELVYFGSSSEDKVCALDADTGRLRWEFHMGGPVRLAPTIANGKLYVGADDGKVYCLDALDGHQVWVFSPAANSEMVLGNGRMISRWPVRTGIVVEDGVAYFGAGIFPAEGLFLCAVSAADGKLLWQNDTFDIGGRGTVSPQGYLVVSPDKLLVPSGRAIPAAFAREDGRFLFQRTYDWRHVGLNGGTYVVLADDLFFNGTEQLMGFNEADGKLGIVEQARRLVVGKDQAYFLTGKQVAAVQRQDWLTTRTPLNTKLYKAMYQAQLHRRAVTGHRQKAKGLEQELRATDLNEGEREKLQDRLSVEKKEAESRQDTLDRSTLPVIRKLEEQLAELTRWTVPCECTDAMLLAAGTLFAGGKDVVKAFAAETGKELWTAPVDGAARSLAVAHGRLLVGTDKGSTYCFVAGRQGEPDSIRPQVVADPFHRDNADAMRETAQGIPEVSGVDRGYGLVLGDGSGPLAAALARQCRLLLHVAEPDTSRAAKLRRQLAAAGLLGARVAVAESGPEPLPYSDYFANLIVCLDSTTPAREVLRMLKPCGGVVLLARGAPGGQDWIDDLREETKRLGETTTEIDTVSGWTRITRGALNGAGRWTHQYADAGNTACGDDQLVRGPIGILWYGKPGPGRMPSRHDSSVAPLALGGRMFVQGENVVMAYDAYNGVHLWEREIEGALRLGTKYGNVGNLTANDGSLFVSARGRCYRLDTATGNILRTYELPVDEGDEVSAGQDDARREPTHVDSLHVEANEPQDERSWSYLACDDRLLYGCRDQKTLFAFEIETGKLRWTYGGKKIVLNTISIDDGRLFFVDHAVTDAQKAQHMEGIEHQRQLDLRGQPVEPDVRRVVALDAATGKEEWQNLQYVSDCVRVAIGAGDISAMAAKGVFVLCGQAWNGHWWDEFFAGTFSRRSLIALSAEDGHSLWSGHKGYRSRPLIVGDTIVAEPWGHDLQTGDERLQPHPVTTVPAKWQFSRPGHHCGLVSAAPNALLFRSGVTAYYDLIADFGTVHFGAQRPGCAINIIAANGLVIVPEAASGCMCPYPMHTSIVFKPCSRTRLSGLSALPGDLTPVKHLAVDLGGIGDRRASDGTLWLAYPRPKMGGWSKPLELEFDLDIQGLSGGDYFRSGINAFQADASPQKWVFSSGYSGLRRCRIPLNKANGLPGTYTVRLYFATPQGDTNSGERVFSVSLQDREVLRDFDLAQEAVGSKGIVKTFTGVEASRDLDITFTPSETASKTGPVLCGVEVMVEDLRLEGGYDGAIQFQAPVSIRKGEVYAMTGIRLRGAVADRGTLYYRHAGEEAFSTVALMPSGAGTFSVSLSGELTQKPFACYLEMQAGQTQARSPAHERLVEVRPDATPPTGVDMLTIQRISNLSADLSWRPAHDDDRIREYRIVRKTKWGIKDLARLGPGTRTFTDDTFVASRLQRNDSVTYGVQAVDYAGRYGVTQNVKGQLPANEPPAVGDLALRAFAVDGEILLSWSGTLEPDVAEIRVLRGASEAGPLELIATLRDRKAYGYTDENKGGEIPWYALQLLDVDEVESEQGVPVQAKPLPLPDIFLSDLDYAWGTAGSGAILSKDMNVAEKPLKLHGKTYEKGLGTQAKSEILYKIDPSYKRFVALFGIDDRPGDRMKFNKFRNIAWREVAHGKFGSVTAEVYVDGKRLHTSALLYGGDLPWPIDVAIPENSRQIRLVVTDGGDNNHWDIADWVNAGFLTATATE